MLAPSTQINSDMTRTIPVYNDRQKPFTMPFYALRMKLPNVPGTLWKQYHIEVGKFTTSELGLGSLTKLTCRKPRQACLQYFMHGTSHHGIDTMTDLTEPMQANMFSQ
jgi:Xaa-Pro aminopeptidase